MTFASDTPTMDAYARYDRSSVVRAVRTEALQIRSLRPGDTRLLFDLLSTLTERTRRLRYMVAGAMSNDIVWAEAARMARGRTQDHVTLMVLTRNGGRRKAIAVAELVRDDRSPLLAELAIVVSDDNQRQGIGRELLRRLIQRAQWIGIRSVRADMLAENIAMRRLINGLGLKYTTTTRYGETQVLMSL